MENVNKLTKENDIMDKKVVELSAKIREFERQKLKHIENENKLANLYELGVIDSAGDFIPFHPNEGDDMS